MLAFYTENAIEVLESTWVVDEDLDNIYVVLHAINGVMQEIHYDTITHRFSTIPTNSNPRHHNVDFDMLVKLLNGRLSCVFSEVDPLSRIASAALMTEDDLIIPVVRHGSRETFKLLLKFNPPVKHRQCKQGFIDGGGRWLNRKEAFSVAINHGQLNPTVVHSMIVNNAGFTNGDLYSEWLY